MDLFPLYNSLRIAVISSIIIFLLGIYLSRIVIKAPRFIRGILDCVFTLPLVLPPTVVGYVILKIIGTNSQLGGLLIDWFDIRISMQWYAGILATTIVSLPLMYRTTRGAFLSLNPDMLDAARTLGHSESYVFWRLMIPNAKQGILAGLVLSFARALGEYGATSMVAGYIPGRTATVATAVYQLWRSGNDDLALKYVLINISISLLILLALSIFERSEWEQKRR
ncbi:MAG: molybdate ABC transporter permease subunit [Clostridia bacterium]